MRYLDDLGVNLKLARAMGMTTIKVDDPAVALAELGELQRWPDGAKDEGRRPPIRRRSVVGQTSHEGGSRVAGKR